MNILKTITLFFIVSALANVAWAYETQHIQIPSAANHKVYPATIILPDGYSQSSKHYPTLYLLHGWGGNNTQWESLTSVGKEADRYGMLVVMPDGGHDKWYMDSAVLKDSHFETYIGTEVVQYMDKNYRTIAKKEGRAITGFSMGGFGAMNIAIHHQDRFGGAGSMSGVMDFRPFAKNWNLKNVFGEPGTNAQLWSERTIANAAQKLVGNSMSVTIDCGTDDFLLEVNRALHQKFLALKVPHDYIERPGDHSWAYWNQAIKYQMLFFNNYFQSTNATENK